MVVADDKVNAFFFGIGYLLYSFDAAIQYDNQSYTGFCGIVYPFGRYPVTFVVAVGDVIVNVRIELLNKLVDQCHCCSAVYIIITINQNTLFLSHCLIKALHGHIHVFHQEWVVQVGQLRAEKLLGILCLRYSPLHQ